MSCAYSEIILLQDLLEEIGVPQLSPIPLYADSMSVIQIANNSVFYKHTKHIQVECHSIHETLRCHEIFVPYISIEDQIADVFTKAISCHHH